MNEEALRRFLPVWTENQLARVLKELSRPESEMHRKRHDPLAYPSERGVFALLPLVISSDVGVSLHATGREKDETPSDPLHEGGFALRFTLLSDGFINDAGYFSGRDTVARVEIPLTGGRLLSDLPRVFLHYAGEYERLGVSDIEERHKTLARLLGRLGRVEISRAETASDGVPQVNVCFGFGWDLPGPGNGKGKYRASATVPLSTLKPFLLDQK